MSQSFLSFLIVIVFLGPAILSGGPTTAGEATAASLQDQGWQVVKKRDRQEKRPGIAPYHDLTRVLQITTLTLAKDGKHQICEMVYDSQRDNISETCRSGDAPK